MTIFAVAIRCCCLRVWTSDNNNIPTYSVTIEFVDFAVLHLWREAIRGVFVFIRWVTASQKNYSKCNHCFHTTLNLIVHDSLPLCMFLNSE
ncbi:unknown [Salmonella phage FelixO1]|uniref:Uncharacterized protein n=1 Tax=Salmonella phage Felix O1 (isolate Felix O1-VT1) TaxID=1283336 RepID=Q6KGC9_BPFO1|nr:unknown [Salmonella phage FelixO1]